MISVFTQNARSKSTYSCGPVRLELEFSESILQEALHSLLAQYDAPWAEPKKTIRATVSFQSGRTEAPTEAGSYLTSYLLKVERQNGCLRSYGNLGSFMHFDLHAAEAVVSAPQHDDWPALVEEVEQQFVLLLARGWAQTGWTPLHAGTLIPPGGAHSILLCAPSGSGKTTLTAAMLRRGWRTLGDDKTLLRKEGNDVIARSLARRFHLHPQSSRWFPEAGDLTKWPTYSRWTDKRVVRIEKLWPDRFEEQSTPRAVVQVERDTLGPPVTLQPLNSVETLNVLLRQVVIPSDAEHARPMVACIASLAGRLRGLSLKIGNDAFSEPATLEQLENEFNQLLA